MTIRVDSNRKAYVNGEYIGDVLDTTVEASTFVKLQNIEVQSITIDDLSKTLAWQRSYLLSRLRPLPENKGKKHKVVATYALVLDEQEIEIPMHILAINASPPTTTTTQSSTEDTDNTDTTKEDSQ